MTEEEKAAWAKEQLLSKCRELGRTPKKEDFDNAARSRIKAFLGPWPRALERAGLKEIHTPKPRTCYRPPEERYENPDKTEKKNKNKTKRSNPAK